MFFAWLSMLHMKGFVWPLVAIAATAVAAILTVELWKTQHRETAAATDPAHAVAQLDIEVAKQGWRASCGASNPTVVDAIEAYPDDAEHLRSLPPAQRELLREVAWRLAGAHSAYVQMFFDDNHGMAEYDERVIVKAAAESMIPRGEGAAFRALTEIEAALPDIYKLPMNCPPPARAGSN
jgi:hypothetical protein